MPKALPQELAEHGLNDKQKKFADSFVVSNNLTEAAIKAGYSKHSAHVNGARLLKHARVAAYVKQKQASVIARADKKFDITTDRILLELARIAFGDIRQIFNEKGELRPVHELNDDVAATIASIEREEKFDRRGHLEGYITKIKKSDKLRALEMLGRYLKMWDADKSSDKNVLNININMGSDQLQQGKALQVIEHAESPPSMLEPMAIVPDGD